jgi:hypothetical protein
MNPGSLCDRCLQVHLRCGAHNREGGPCNRWPKKGAPVCWKHGGATPQVRAAAEARVVEAQLAAAAQTFGVRRDISPGEALIEDVQWTAGHVEWLRAQVQALEAEQLTWGTSKETDQQSGQGRQGTDTVREARLNGLVDLYQRERKHLVDVSAATLRAGVEVKRLELAQQAGQTYAAMMRAVLSDSQLALTPEQLQVAHEVVVRHMKGLNP